MLISELSATPTLEEVQEAFAHDRFSSEACHCRVVKAERGHAVCEFDITDRHRNGFGSVMGGAIFTLADFALGVACNIGEPRTVGISNTIEYIASTKESKLIATCNADRSGRKVGFYTVDVTDDKETLIARMVATCVRLE